MFTTFSAFPTVSMWVKRKVPLPYCHSSTKTDIYLGGIFAKTTVNNAVVPVTKGFIGRLNINDIIKVNGEYKLGTCKANNVLTGIVEKGKEILT